MNETPENNTPEELPVELEPIRQESMEQVDCPLCGKIFEVFVTQTFTPVQVEGDEDGFRIQSDRTADMTEVKKHIQDHMDGNLPVSSGMEDTKKQLAGYLKGERPLNRKERRRARKGKKK